MTSNDNPARVLADMLLRQGCKVDLDSFEWVAKLLDRYVSEKDYDQCNSLCGEISERLHHETHLVMKDGVWFLQSNPVWVWETKIKTQNKQGWILEEED